MPCLQQGALHYLAKFFYWRKYSFFSHFSTVVFWQLIAQCAHRMMERMIGTPKDIRMLSLRHLPLLLIVLLYWGVGALYAIYTPAWQSPDEPAHYNHVRQLLQNGCCVLMQAGDWDAAYLESIKAAAFAPELLGNFSAIQYEDHQPALYYVLLTPMAALTDGNIVALRLVSVLFGTLIVVSAYGMAWLMLHRLPNRAWLAPSVAAFVAFLPQHVHILASVNNDALGWALIALTLWAAVRHLVGPVSDELPFRPVLIVCAALFGGLLLAGVLLVGRGEPTLWVLVAVLALVGAAGAWLLRRADAGVQAAYGLGVLVGLVLATKATGYYLAAVAPLALYLRHLLTLPPDPLANLRGAWHIMADRVGEARERTPLMNLAQLPETLIAWVQGLYIAIPHTLKRLLRSPRRLAALWGVYLAVALVIGGVWWGRNLLIYGGTDFLGLRAHDAVVATQLRTQDDIAQVGIDAYREQFVRVTFTSFWGQFGWMALPISGWMLALAAGLTVTAAAGWLVRAGLLWAERHTHTDDAQPMRAAWLLLGVSATLATAAYFYYNSEFVQFQGRYLYAGLLPFALMFVLGLEAWVLLVARVLGGGQPVARVLGGDQAGQPASHVLRIGGWLLAAGLVAFAAWDLYILWRVIVPNL
jgi:hypothetical protein